jgi:hypothetical protein
MLSGSGQPVVGVDLVYLDVGVGTHVSYTPRSTHWAPRAAVFSLSGRHRRSRVQSPSPRTTVQSAPRHRAYRVRRASESTRYRAARTGRGPDTRAAGRPGPRTVRRCRYRAKWTHRSDGLKTVGTQRRLAERVHPAPTQRRRDRGEQRLFLGLRQGQHVHHHHGNPNDIGCLRNERHPTIERRWPSRSDMMCG